MNKNFEVEIFFAGNLRRVTKIFRVERFFRVKGGVDMKNFFRRALTAVFIVACVFLGGNESICSAEYFSGDGYTSNGRFFSASVLDAFFQYNKSVFISISKVKFILNDYPRDDFYFYKITIVQMTEENPFDIKTIRIMAEFDSVEIPTDIIHHKEGLISFTDEIFYDDTGKVNRIIKSVGSMMLIRITTTGGVVYDFYPSKEYIADAKRVADWAYP